MMPSAGAAIKLRIYDEWWLWEGYLSDGYRTERPVWKENTRSIDVWLDFAAGVWRWKEPRVDGRYYEAEHLFPLLKPDIDVLGVPSRSRKQRGWYQITSRGILPLDAPTAVHAIAAELPPELLTYILEIGSTDRLFHDRDLQALSLVCRHFSDFGAYKRLGRAVVRSRAHLFAMKDDLGHPLSLVRHNLHHLNMVHNLVSFPFLHAPCPGLIVAYLCVSLSQVSAPAADCRVFDSCNGRSHPALVCVNRCLVKLHLSP